MRATVARRCVAAGAVLVNDVTGGLGDPAMLAAVAGLGVPYVVMHWRGPSAVMDELARYDDVVTEVVDELAARVEAAVAAGVELERIVVDPGIGFAKTATHNWALLQRLDALQALGRPVLVGASRKRFLSHARPDRPHATTPPQRCRRSLRRRGCGVFASTNRPPASPPSRSARRGVPVRWGEGAFALRACLQRHRRGARWR